LTGGRVREDISDSLDLGRTLFACAGIASPSCFKGRDLFSAPAPEAIYSTIGYGEPFSRMAPNGNRGTWFGERGWPRRSCVRTSRFRLDKNMRIDGHRPAPEDEDVFLADVVADPGERVNLAEDPAFQDVRRRLSALLDDHAKGAVEVPPELLKRPAQGKKAVADA
jgi:choline-sulfatase